MKKNVYIKMIAMIICLLCVISATGCNSNQQDISQDSSSALTQDNSSDVSQDNAVSDYIDYPSPENAYFCAENISELKNFIDTEGDVEIFYYDAEYEGQKWSEREDMRPFFEWVRERGSMPIVSLNSENSKSVGAYIWPWKDHYNFTITTAEVKEGLEIFIVPLDENEQKQDIQDLFDARYANDENIRQSEKRNNDIYGEHFTYKVFSKPNFVFTNIVYRYNDCLLHVIAKDGIDIENGYSEWFEIKEYTPNYK